MKYIDSNIFIYPVIADEKTESKAASSKQVLLQIAGGKIDAATSCLTWDELVWVLAKFLGRNTAVAEGRKFLAFPNLKFIDVSETTINRAQDLIDEYGMKPRDAIHAASALENGIKEVLSDDPDLDKVREFKRVKL